MPVPMEVRSRPTSYRRRAIGVLVGCAPVLLIIASIVAPAASGDRPRSYALVVMVVALLIAGLNFHLSFTRPLLHHRMNGSPESYRHVSGVPLIGSVLVVVATVLSFGSVLCAVLGLLAVALDTGGTVWFLWATWRDPSFWDR